MDPIREYALMQSRRYFFSKTAAGLGTAALASVMNPKLFAAEPATTAVVDPMKTFGNMQVLHHPPTAKRVIWLFMADAPSQLALYDYKPKLQEYYDKDLPDSVRN